MIEQSSQILEPNNENKQLSLIHSFFLFNDVEHCVRMNNFLLNELFNLEKGDELIRSFTADLVLFNTQVTELLVNLYQLDQH